MSRWMGWVVVCALIGAAACKRDDGSTDDTDPAERDDPWEDDVLVSPITDLDGLRVTGVPWFGLGDGSEPLVVVERRDDLRPVGQALVRLGEQPTVLITAQDLVDDTESDGMLDVRADARGHVSFTTAADCWGWWADDTLDTRCADLAISYRGPLVQGWQPAFALAADRQSFELGTWTGSWEVRDERPTGGGPVGEWVMDGQGRMWIISGDLLQQVTSEGRTSLVDIREQSVWEGANPGSARFRGLSLTPSGRPSVVMTGVVDTQPRPGVGLYELDGSTLVPRVDLTAPIVDGQRLAFLGTGGEPAMHYGLTRDDRMVFLGELVDGRQGIYAQQGSGFEELVVAGQPATDRFGERVQGVTWSALGSAVMGPDGAMVFTAILDGDGITADNRYGVWAVLADGSSFELARTGSRVPQSSDTIERILLHGGRLVFPDPRDQDPARRRGAPDAGNDNDTSLVMWGAPGWNHSIRTQDGCTRALLVLQGEEGDEALVQREVGEGC